VRLAEKKRKDKLDLGPLAILPELFASIVKNILNSGGGGSGSGTIGSSIRRETVVVEKERVRIRRRA